MRQWLSENHDKESECWGIVKRGKAVEDGTFRYIDAVEEALCFGWIDSTVKKTDDGIAAQALPRRDLRREKKEVFGRSSTKSSAECWKKRAE